ncbi:MAG: CDP-alcohol phosphatidyltransferase family protein [Nanoarchaeota archaeon]|nr:CDP-alcohol phosphatidyltransferase family protein [Nanoarchaeota archaeon]
MTEEKYDFQRAKKENLELADRMLRWISFPISKLIIRYTSITPNQITLFSFLLSLAGGFFFLQGEYKDLVTGGILIFLRQIFDQVDGEVARIKGLGSTFGKWFDGITGYLSVELIIFSLAIGIGTPLAYLVGGVAALAYPLQYLFVYFYKLEVVNSSEPITIGKGNKFNFLRQIYGSALFYVLVPLFAFMNKPLWALLFFAVVGNLFWMGTLAVQYLALRRNIQP